MKVSFAEPPLALVDADGAVIGSGEKQVVHKNPPQRHSASSVWVFNEEGEVLFQQRSAKKMVGALWWANTVCGNVRVTETNRECAERRLREELGLSAIALEYVTTFEYKAYCNEQYSEHELDTLFVSLIKKPTTVSGNPDEVIDTAWIPFIELQQALLHIDYCSVTETLTASWEELSKLTPPVTITVADRTLTIAPWTVLMLPLVVIPVA